MEKVKRLLDQVMAMAGPSEAKKGGVDKLA